MHKFLIKVDRNIPEAKYLLEQYGNIRIVSRILNIFLLECTISALPNIKDINGVISIEEDMDGELLFI